MITLIKINFPGNKDLIQFSKIINYIKSIVLNVIMSYIYLGYGM